MEVWKKTWKKYAGKYQPFLAVIAVGILLMLFSLPKAESPTEEPNTLPTDFDLKQFEAQIGASLASIEGAGRVKVMLTLESTEQSVYASDTQSAESTGDHTSSRSSQSSTSILSDGNYGEEPILIQSNYPTFRGAVVICDGADNSTVCLEITETVAALCGLSADHISIVRMSR